MDNIQLILYILFLVGYFIFKLITGKKTSGQQQEGQDPFDTGSAPHAPPYQEARSLEDILDEIVTGKRKEEKPEPKPVAIQEESLEKTSWYDDDDTLYQYEKAVSNAKQYKTLEQKLAESEIKIGDVEDLDEIGAESTPSNSYLDMFENLEDAQKAIVMSEIINKKY